MSEDNCIGFYTQANPLLPPDWRWEKAHRIVADRKYASRRRYDDATRRAVAYLRDSLRCHTDTSIHRLSRRYPDVHLAAKLRETEPRRRLETECRLLARQSSRRIAAVLAIPAPVVEAYEQLFLDVRDRIDAVGYIRSIVIGIDDPAACVEQLMKWSAYRHGAAVIGPWLDYLEHREESHDLTTEIGWQRDNFDLYVAAQRLGLASIRAEQSARPLAIMLGMSKIPRPQQSPGQIFAEITHQTLSQIDFVGLQEPAHVAEPTMTNPIALYRSPQGPICEAS